MDDLAAFLAQYGGWGVSALLSTALGILWSRYCSIEDLRIEDLKAAITRSSNEIASREAMAKQFADGMEAQGELVRAVLQNTGR